MQTTWKETIVLGISLLLAAAPCLAESPFFSPDENPFEKAAELVCTVPVPEPGTIFMLCAGLGLALFRKK